MAAAQRRPKGLFFSTPDPTQRDTSKPGTLVGLVGSGDKVLLRIRLTPHPPLTARNGRSTPGPALAGPNGLEIMHEQQRIGYVDFAAVKACVWPRDDLPPGLRFLTATTLSALLLKSVW
ncbi:hypothetical protein [Hymenobacter sp. B1770]|uniref:hypothetical protein n=1 Tax=Hymenobacter sp. B1770 TaxID=1718788 RepID=UPI003CF8C1BB